MWRSSNDNGNSSKNVTLLNRFRILSNLVVILTCNSNSLKKSNVGEFSWNWILGDQIQVAHSVVFTSSMNCAWGNFTLYNCRCAVIDNKCTKTCDNYAHAKLLFCYALLTFLLLLPWSLLKVPNVSPLSQTPSREMYTAIEEPVVQILQTEY